MSATAFTTVVPVISRAAGQGHVRSSFAECSFFPCAWGGRRRVAADLKLRSRRGPHAHGARRLRGTSQATEPRTFPFAVVLSFPASGAGEDAQPDKNPTPVPPLLTIRIAYAAAADACVGEGVAWLSVSCWEKVACTHLLSGELTAAASHSVLLYDLADSYA